MQPRITVLTLGVDDLERAVTFYRDGLGLKTEGIVGTEFEHGAVAFFDLQAGLKLALWPRTSLAHDAGLPVGPPRRHFGAATRATFKIPSSISGRSFGIRSGCSQSKLYSSIVAKRYRHLNIWLFKPDARQPRPLTACLAPIEQGRHRTTVFTALLYRCLPSMVQIQRRTCDRYWR
jgi:catechol 2,3-dioxygenase-like lactoylglutathione lyase family enzyme